MWSSGISSECGLVVSLVWLCVCGSIRVLIVRGCCSKEAACTWPGWPRGAAHMIYASSITRSFMASVQALSLAFFHAFRPLAESCSLSIASGSVLSQSALVLCTPRSSQSSTIAKALSLQVPLLCTPCQCKGWFLLSFLPFLLPPALLPSLLHLHCSSSFLRYHALLLRTSISW